MDRPAELPCEKCGGRMCHVATMPGVRASENGYVVFQCERCAKVRWVEYRREAR